MLSTCLNLKSDPCFAPLSRMSCLCPCAPYNIQRKQDQKVDSASGDANFEALAKYGTDLTANAARLDPVIGRDEEIRRVVRILSR